MTTTTTTPKVAVNHRAFFRAALDGLSYDNTTRAEAKAAVVAVVPAGASPAQWVAAAETVRLVCRRCAGTGRFITGTLNGQPTGPGGECFRCSGRGTQAAEDGHRNRAHDRHAMVRAFRAMMA